MPLQIDEEEQFIGAVREQLNLEKELETAKIRLAAQSDFNLIDAFHMIDLIGKGWFNAPDLSFALETHGLKHNF